MRYTLAGVDAKTIASTVIFTSQPGRQFIITDAVARTTAAVAIAVGATISIGTNGATYNNIAPAVAMLSLTANTYDMVLGRILAVSPIVVPAATDVRINVSLAATGTS